MKFFPATLEGVVRIELEPRLDSRGSLVRTYCEREFSDAGLPIKWPQLTHTVTNLKGGIRGLHYQADPVPEDKLVRCLKGEVWDVVVDIRPDSPTYGKWESFLLSENTNDQIFVPAGFAHGFQCLTEDCHIFYQMSEFYDSELNWGIRWNDPDLAIRWPLELTSISERDAALPFFKDIS